MIEYIAEFGQSARGDINVAIKQIEAAKEAGFTTIKWQAFDPKLIASADAKRYWANHLGGSETQLETFETNGMFRPADWRTLVAECYSRDMRFLCTPFDIPSVEYLEEAGVSAYKIASGDITFKQLIEAVSETNKSIILSTGASSEAEVATALSWIQHDRVTLLACDLQYPCDKPNLGRIRTLEKFGLRVGYSDHMTSAYTSTMAVAAGAKVLEKHCTLGGTGVPDDMMALLPRQMKQYVDCGNDAELFLGNPTLVSSAEEQAARVGARRSVYLAHDIKVNTQILPDDLVMLRPGGGIPPADADKVIGAFALRDIPAGTRLTEADIRW